MEAKDTVMRERDPEYDANCGQEICCDVLPKYLTKESVESCYLEISKLVEEFVEAERQAQAEISFKAGIREVVEFSNDICVLHGDADARTRQGRVLRKGHCKMCWETQLKAWGIEIDHQG